MKRYIIHLTFGEAEAGAVFTTVAPLLANGVTLETVSVSDGRDSAAPKTSEVRKGGAMEAVLKHLLSIAPSGATSTDIAPIMQAAGLSGTSASPTFSRLKQAGLVVRRAGVVHHLTPAGEAEARRER